MADTWKRRSYDFRGETVSPLTFELLRTTTATKAHYLIDKATRNELRVAKGQLRMQLQVCWEDEIPFIKQLVDAVSKRLRTL